MSETMKWLNNWRSSAAMSFGALAISSVHHKHGETLWEVFDLSVFVVQGLFALMLYRREQAAKAGN